MRSNHTTEDKHTLAVVAGVSWHAAARVLVDAISALAAILARLRLTLVDVHYDK